MITRFRVEAKGPTKIEVEKDLADFTTETQNRLAKAPWGEMDRGKWECTQDVVSGQPGNYEGRQVWNYNGD